MRTNTLASVFMTVLALLASVCNPAPLASNPTVPSNKSADPLDKNSTIPFNNTAVITDYAKREWLSSTGSGLIAYEKYMFLKDFFLADSYLDLNNEMRLFFPRTDNLKTNIQDVDANNFLQLKSIYFDYTADIKGSEIDILPEASENIYKMRYWALFKNETLVSSMRTGYMKINDVLVQAAPIDSRIKDLISYNFTKFTDFRARIKAFENATVPDASGNKDNQPDTKTALNSDPNGNENSKKSLRDARKKVYMFQSFHNNTWRGNKEDKNGSCEVVNEAIYSAVFDVLYKVSDTVLAYPQFINFDQDMKSLKVVFEGFIRVDLLACEFAFNPTGSSKLLDNDWVAIDLSNKSPLHENTNLPSLEQAFAFKLREIIYGAGIFSIMRSGNRYTLNVQGNPLTMCDTKDKSFRGLYGMSHGAPLSNEGIHTVYGTQTVKYLFL